MDYVKIWVEEGGIGMNFKLKKAEAGGGKVVAGNLEYLFGEATDGSGTSYRVKKFKKL